MEHFKSPFSNKVRVIKLEASIVGSKGDYLLVSENDNVIVLDKNIYENFFATLSSPKTKTVANSNTKTDARPSQVLRCFGPDTSGAYLTDLTTQTIMKILEAPKKKSPAFSGTLSSLVKSKYITRKPFAFGPGYFYNITPGGIARLHVINGK